MGETSNNSGKTHQEQKADSSALQLNELQETGDNVDGLEVFYDDLPCYSGFTDDR